MLKSKIITEFQKGRGVRIGESSIASTKLHMFDIYKGMAIVVKNRDVGMWHFKESVEGRLVHIDTYHSPGQANCINIVNMLKYSLKGEYSILVNTSGGTGYINGNTSDVYCTNNELFRNHVHMVMKIPPSKYELIIIAVSVVEQCLLRDNLNLKKIESIKCFRYLIIKSFFKFDPARRLLDGEDFSLPVKRVRRDDGSISYTSNSICSSPHKKISKKNEDIAKIADYLKKNTCFRKEKIHEETADIFKKLAVHEKGDWIEELAVSETVISLVREKYYQSPASQAENCIKVYKSYAKDYKNTIFLIDNSASMMGKSMENVKGAVIDICNKLKGEAAIVTFNGETSYLYYRFTNNKEKIRKLVGDITISNMTPLAHALSIAYDYGLKSLRKYINIIVLTDGEPNVPIKSDNPLADCIEISRKIGKKGYNLCCISTSDEASALSKIAEAANGSIYNLQNFDKKQLYNIMNKELK